MVEVKKKNCIISVNLNKKARFIFEQLEKTHNKRGDYGWKSRLFSRLLIDSFDTADITKKFAKVMVAQLNHERLSIDKQVVEWATIAGAYDD